MLLIALSYRMAVKSNYLVEESSNIATIMLQDQKLGAAEADEIQKREFSIDEPLEINFWGDAGETVLESRINEQKMTVSLVLTGEKTGLIVPGSDVLSWKEYGCFLDSATAFELFGMQQAIGQTIWCKDRMYTVCGTFESVQKVMVCRAARQDGQVFTTISCRIPERGSVSSHLENFLMRHGMAGKYSDFTFLGYVSHDFLLLLPVCLAIRLIRILMNVRGKRGGRANLTVYFLILVIVSGTMIFAGLNFRVPADMIPTAWSDFSFWGHWWKTQRENLLYIFRTTQGEAQLSMLWNFFRSVFGSMWAVVCTFLFLC